MRRLLVGLALAALVATVTRASPKPSGGSAMSTEEQWIAAEKLVGDRFKKDGKPAHELRRHEHTPCLLTVRYTGGEDYKLVWNGRIVDGKGLAKLGAYLKESRFLERHATPREDVETLVNLFDALPTRAPGAGWNQGYFVDAKRYPDMVPKLEFADGAARFILHYPEGSGRHGGGESMFPEELRASKWTLTIPATYKLAWTMEYIHYSEPPPP
jgi:hypothetical protein